jgi:uncharacterized Zn finger protein
MSKKKYPIRIPRYAAGIRAQESRTGSVRSWWAKRWQEVIERMGLGARLGRGKNYALSGQVLSMAIQGSRVVARVVGARPDPYAVTLDFREPTGESRKRIIARLKAQPMTVARILADDLPVAAESFFREEGFDLFPGGRLAPGRYDMTTGCSCPDYANPCKHVSAVLLILGEEIARRPSTLLALRGIAVEELYDEN